MFCKTVPLNERKTRGMAGIMSESREGCNFEGRSFPQGADLCFDQVCKVCDNGEFKIPPELSMNDQDVLADPGEAYFSPSA